MGQGNGGVVKSKVPGGTIVESFGKDTSDYCGSASDERGGGMGGSKESLAHSLSGSSATLRVKD